MEHKVSQKARLDTLKNTAADTGLRARSSRVNRLYALLQERMTQKQKAWGEGLTILDKPHATQLPLVLRHTKAIERTLLEMPITIEEDDLIVGNNAEDGVIVRPQLLRYATAEERAQAKEEGITIEATLAHKTPYYYDVLEKGLSGIIADIDHKIANIKARPQSHEHDEKLALLQAMRLECNAVITMANRYADLAEKLRLRTDTSKRRDELLKITQVCRRVPEFPARTFHEAVQSFWFVNYALFSTQTLVACGRLDQFLYPSLKRELDAGTITLDEAQEIIDCLWLRFNDRAQICRENFVEGDDSDESEAGSVSNETASKPSLVSGAKIGRVTHNAPGKWAAGHRTRPFAAKDAADAINHWGQNVLISGIQPDGSDGTNELTYMSLNAAEKLALTSPVLSLRLHRNSPPELLHRCAEVLKSGGGMPYINNDDAIIQAYVDLGVPLEDARDYANSNCWETMIQGKSDQELIRGINFLLFLELALNHGSSHVHGQLGTDTGDPREFSSFQQLMDAWKLQTDHQIKQGIDYIGYGVTNGTLDHSGHSKYSYNPFLSALTLDCIEKENDITHCGARYTIWHTMAEGVANAIDSMAAIKKTVFEDKTLTMDQLLTALEADWKGYENLRKRLIARTPKFANDNDYADDIGREMMAYFIEKTRLHADRWYPTVIFPCSVGTFSWIISIGKEVAATPDGRYYGEPVAANFSPSLGTDVSGPTAAINSYVKMYSAHFAAGAPIDLRLSGTNLKDNAGTQRLAGLIKSFIELGGNMITLTVTDVEELKRAMKEPEKYRQLRVRMGGWSAYFVMLSKEHQLLHISRIEHGLV